MTRMIRPCTHEAFNDNEAFEAIGAVVSVVEGGTSNGVQQFAVKLDLANGHSEELDFENRGRAYYTYQSVLLAIYEALNAPVLVTQEVLDTAKEEYLDDSYYYRVDENARFLTDETFLRNVNPIHLLGMEILPTCPLSLDFLLKFYTDGTPIQVGG